MSLRDLAHAAGIDTDYVSWRGAPAVASDEAIRRALAALAPDLGVDVLGCASEVALAALERRRWAERVPPVMTAWGGELIVPLRVRADRDADVELQLVADDGAVLAELRAQLYALPADSHAYPGDEVWCIRRCRIASSRLGYHALRWRVGDESGESLVLAAPERAFGAPGEAPRRWGVFAPVYGLASPESGQAGDLGALRRLFDAVAARGGSYVATLPILAALHDDHHTISPYSPVSRLHWNEIYLDLAPLGAELGLVVPAAPPEPYPALIDYRAQYAWRRPILDRLARGFLAEPARRAEIDAWAAARGVFDYAAFRALGETSGQAWHDWPARARDASFAATREAALALGADPARVDTHVFAQWAMQRQLEALRGGPVSLYLDLPVGVSAGAYEVWRWRHLFLTGLATGAPPDALFLGGQNWALPPLSPIALRADRYRYAIACVRHHMQVAGMLRIDHVMGLFRLYCVPAGLPAHDGVYVRYHADDLLAIVALESHRARCAVAGEDLGTVPEPVRPAMLRHGLYRLHVGQWAFPSERGQRSAPAPAEAIASLNTHDTATFAGWWQGADIDDQLDLGLVGADVAEAEQRARARAKAAVLALAEPRDGGRDRLDIERAMVAVTRELAEGPAEVVLVALDDLALEAVPHNVPGTSSERPNWQRHVRGWSEALGPDAPPAAAAAIDAVAATRPR